MKIIGLTGSIGVGKSMASGIFKDELNIPIIDADKLSFEVVKKGSIALKEIENAFGSDIIDEFGNLDRKYLASVVFNYEKKRKILNDIIHPRVLDEFNKEVGLYKNKGEKVVIFDCPLLLESNIEHLVDIILVITSDYDIQLDRIVRRDNMSINEAKQRIDSQMSQEEKIKRADYIIENNGTYEDLKEKIIKFYEKMLA